MRSSIAFGDREHERLLVVAERVVVAVGVGDVRRAGREWLERSAQRRDAGDRERAEGGAVVRDLARDHLVALSLPDGAEVLARELPRRLHRFGPAAREEHAVEVARREVGHAGRELDRGRMRVVPDREVRELLRLLASGLGELAAAVAHLHGEQARQPVEQPLAGRVPHVATLAARDDVDRMVVVVAAEPREVHPQVAACELAQFGRRARAGQAVIVRCFAILRR